MRSYVVIVILLAAPISFGAFKNPKCQTVTQKSWTTSFENCKTAYQKEAQENKVAAVDNSALCECITDEFFLKKDCATINGLFKSIAKVSPFDAKKAMSSAFAGPITTCKERFRIKANESAVEAQKKAGGANTLEEDTTQLPTTSKKKK